LRPQALGPFWFGLLFLLRAPFYHATAISDQHPPCRLRDREIFGQRSDASEDARIMRDEGKAKAGWSNPC
jgi:hypothetical protein